MFNIWCFGFGKHVPIHLCLKDWDKFTIVGTSQNIFKDYLRLTTVSLYFLSRIFGHVRMHPSAIGTRSQRYQTIPYIAKNVSRIEEKMA